MPLGRTLQRKNTSWSGQLSSALEQDALLTTTKRTLLNSGNSGSQVTRQEKAKERERESRAEKRVAKTFRSKGGAVIAIERRMIVKFKGSILL